MLDNNKNQNVIAFSVAAIMANGVYDAAEKGAVFSIAESFEINEKTMLDAIDTEIAKQKAMSDEELIAYLKDISKDLSPEDTVEIYQICIVITLADGKLCKMETMKLVAFAEILQIHTVYATMLIAYAVNKDPNFTVEFSL